MKTVHLEITGKVQGVFFRASAREIAGLHHLTGWIKNSGHDKVEAMVTGADEAIEAFISWCKQGPERAKVTNLRVIEKKTTVFDSFDIIR